MRTVQRLITILWLILLFTVANRVPGQAHGGVVIDTGFTEHFEWLVSIDPYPTLLGEATLTLLAYDIATYEPMNDLTVTLYLAAPDAPRPCCQPENHEGPIELTIDPEIYPGDYSNVVTFDEPGEWALQFVATAPEPISGKSFEVVVPLQIHATMGGSQPIAISADETPDIAATSTLFAQNVAEARQSNSPLVASSPLETPAQDGSSNSSSPETSPETSPATDAPAVTTAGGTNWLLWGGLGLIPIVLIGWFILGAGPRDNEPTDS